MTPRPLDRQSPPQDGTVTLRDSGEQKRVQAKKMNVV